MDEGDRLFSSLALNGYDRAEVQFVQNHPEIHHAEARVSDPYGAEINSHGAEDPHYPGRDYCDRPHPERQAGYHNGLAVPA